MSGSYLTFILGSLVVFFVSMFSWAVRVRSEKEIIVAVIAASATVLTSVFAIVVTQANTKAKELRESHRIQKIEVYSEFGDLVFSIFSLVKIPEREDLSEEEREKLLKEKQEELQVKFGFFSKKLLLWGSPEVLDAWLKFRSYSQALSQQSNKTSEAALRNLLYMDRVFRAMRKDLELSNSGLQEGDLVKSFLTDPESIDRLLASRGSP